jgi:hypothetical protein
MQFWLLTAIGAVSVILVVVNMMLFQNNRDAQKEFTARQQYIQQSIQLQVLYNEMVKATADLSIRFQDVELANLLKSHGVAFTPAPGAPGLPETPKETK